MKGERCSRAAFRSSRSFAIWPRHLLWRGHVDGGGGGGTCLHLCTLHMRHVCRLCLMTSCIQFHASCFCLEQQPDNCGFVALKSNQRVSLISTAANCENASEGLRVIAAPRKRGAATLNSRAAAAAPLLSLPYLKLSATHAVLSVR